MEAEAHIDTTNDHFVGVSADQILVMIPIVGHIPRARALRLAAWIVALADESEGNADFLKVLKAVSNT